MSKTIREDLDIIRNLTKTMPKTINEAIDFDKDLPIDEPMHEMPEDEPEYFESEPEKEQEPKNNSETARTLIDDIRKRTLRAMAELADTPDCPEYENLKRIWQLCDKVVTEKQPSSKSEEL